MSYTPAEIAPAASTTSAPTPAQTAGQDVRAASSDGAAVSYTAGHLRVGDLVDVPVVETVAPDEEGVVRPSTLTGAALANLPDVAATVYVMHAGGNAPGTALTGPAGEPAVEVGDPLVLPDGATATVTTAFIADKGAAGARAAEAFADAENVVVVTCRPEGAAVSTSNVVVVAERVRT